MKKEMITLVDESDNAIGTGEKMKVHEEGKLHRSFSIFVFNSKGQILIQKRAKTKYHSGGLWTNTCCSHPRPGESIEKAAHRRLKEEMGFDCKIREIFSFTYKVKFDNDLFENEYDHVFVGNFNGKPVPNPAEVEDWMFVDLDELKKDIRNNPEKFTYWFKIALNKLSKVKK